MYALDQARSNAPRSHRKQSELREIGQCLFISKR